MPLVNLPYPNELDYNKCPEKSQGIRECIPDGSMSNAIRRRRNVLADRTLSLEARIEALLFVAPEAMSMEHLCQVLQVDEETVQAAGQRLAESLAHCGIRLQQHQGDWQLVTAAEAAADVERFLGLEAEHSKPSRAALETLAIVAYKQPVTRAQIAVVRGVSSDGVLRNLVNMGLVEEVGRLERPGRPILYGTTSAFLQYFGLESLAQLPALDEDRTQVLADSLESALRGKSKAGQIDAG